MRAEKGKNVSLVMTQILYSSKEKFSISDMNSNMTPSSHSMDLFNEIGFPLIRALYDVTWKWPDDTKDLPPCLVHHTELQGKTTAFPKHLELNQ